MMNAMRETASPEPEAGRRSTSVDLLSSGTLVPTMFGAPPPPPSSTTISPSASLEAPPAGTAAAVPATTGASAAATPPTPPPLPPRPAAAMQGPASAAVATPQWPWLLPDRDAAADAAEAAGNGTDLLLSFSPAGSPSRSPIERGMAVSAVLASVSPSAAPSSHGRGSSTPPQLRVQEQQQMTRGSFSIREAMFVSAAAAAPATSPARGPEREFSFSSRDAARLPSIGGTHPGYLAAAEAAGAAAAAVEAGEAAAAGAQAAGEAATVSDFASGGGRGRAGGESPRPRLHGRLDATSAAAAAERPRAVTARGVSQEESLTAEQAQAIIDAADMAAAEAVVAAVEAQEAIAVAAATSPSRTAPGIVVSATAAGTGTGIAAAATVSQPESAVRRILRNEAGDDGDDATAVSAPPAIRRVQAPPPQLAAAIPSGGGGGGSGGAIMSEEEEVAAAVAAVAELEARDRLNSGSVNVEVAGPVVQRGRANSGAGGAGTLRCALCMSTNVSAVHPPGGNTRRNGNSSSSDKNCRNCWRVVCDDCIGTFWARNMVPPRYASEGDGFRMRVCKTCNAAMEAFRTALLLGRAEDAMSAYSTGCVNLDRPYTVFHGELPVHCAAAGGNVGLLSWLVEELGCSIFTDSDKKVPIRDLRSLTVLGAAAVNGQVQAMRYLVNQQGCSVLEIKHLPTLKIALDACLHGSAKTRVTLELQSGDYVVGR
ncbi:conserved unknown protein [Ectocarpus siliculosus]|uniref:FYVE-type domain-containing protein n=1 Tax=Ectocarpus siliculosus TaxID=2880 RepID=D7FYF5_ECTSI|nr:conserved unknown protein [Ectocarpus siliculosus]|eukprot:CBJ32497.1 conserved unknown protein [Ectocarpus siliculosus]